MPPFPDPAFQARCNAKSAAKRQAWASLRRALKLGALSPLEGLNHPTAQDRPVVDVVGHMFGRRGAGTGRNPTPVTSRALTAMNRVGVSPPLEHDDLSRAQHRAPDAPQALSVCRRPAGDCFPCAARNTVARLRPPPLAADRPPFPGAA
jgi:hypothetical protein